jgi:diacylglycerol O-acyltransferase
MTSALSEAVPPVVARPLIRLGLQLGALRRLRPGNLMISNLPGPDFPLYFGGMRMEAAYPLGPVVDGVALNITVQSYLGSVFVGINAAATAVSDLPALARAMVAELDHLIRAADVEEASRPAPYERMGSIERLARSAARAGAHSDRPAHSGARSRRPSRSLDQAS